MATIKKYTKKDGSTAYQFNAYLGVDTLTGKSKRTTRRGFKTQKEAKLALAQLQLEVESNGFVKQQYNTFEEVYELWYVQYVNTVKKSTAVRIEYLFSNQILPTFGDLRLNKINTSTCQKIINTWSENYPNSYRKLKTYVQRIFQFAINLHLINKNPMEHIIMPKVERKKKSDENKFLDKKQLKELLSIIEKKESQIVNTILRTLAYTGMRKGELFSLTWKDIDFKNETIEINKTGNYISGQLTITSTKTVTSERTISIDTTTSSFLKKWKLEQKKIFLTRGIRVKDDSDQLVFSTEKNELYYNAFLNDILKKYPQFNITPHGFRHTHASLLFESGATIKQVQERLGHADIHTTMNIYTHVTKSAEKDTAVNFLKYMDS